jgi:hypothetical protein
MYFKPSLLLKKHENKCWELKVLERKKKKEEREIKKTKETVPKHFG